MKLIFFALILMSALTNLKAASTPWYGVLTASGTAGAAITIPAGKILIVQQIGINVNAASAAVFTVSGSAAGGIGSGTFSFSINYGVISNTTITLATPLRVGPGMTLTNVSQFGYNLIGIAEDSSDFYAAASPAFSTPSLVDSRLSATVDTHTTLPTTIIGETSTDLKTWTTAGVDVARSQSNSRIAAVSTAADSPEKFLRAKVIIKSATPNSN